SMSALAGILNLNGAPVDRRALAWDGRLDNRHELISQLRDSVDNASTDIDTVMASYLRWGIDFLPHLIGDFALSLWEPATRTLILARDAFGTRPIYYHANPHRILWSSDLASLIDVAKITIEIDREYIASYLNSTPYLERTAYRGIHSVRPGSALIVRRDGIEKLAFWRPDVKREIRYQSDSEYEEHFRNLFREAVRCRLRSDGPVWAELSGGLDSSSIVCMADHIIKSGEAETSRLETVSYVYDNSPASDERRFIGEVEGARGRTGHHFHEDESVGRFLSLNFAAVVRPNPIYRFTARHDWVRARMQQTGSRVLLSGVAGDNLMWSRVDVSPQLADLLVQLKFPSLHRHVTQWSHATHDSYAETLWRGAVRPNLSQRRSSTIIHPRFREQINLVARTIDATDTLGFQLPSTRTQARMLSSAIRAVASCYYRDRVLTEYRFPFLHRPLVEFVLAIPMDQKLRPGENRSLQRRALKHLLPPSILRRQSKRTSAEALCRSLANNWREIEWVFKEPRVCEYGFVDAAAFAETAKRIRHGTQNLSGELLSVLSVELWLRALELRNSSSQEVKLAS
ncbi:MAG TPA: asparagine synthase-related protein, partial [Pyrinomonadaceae bacterium]|nr:asparagine synthase-related protein [Pyrinomonadaceae bacterium]